MTLVLPRPGGQIVAADQAGMADRNRRLVLELIKRTGPTSRAEVARSITLSKPTVSAIVEELVAEGSVVELGINPQAPVTRGRPPRLIAFHARSEFVVGVHLGVQQTQIQLVDGLGGVVNELAESTPGGQPEAVLGAVRRLVVDTLHAADVRPSEVRRLTVCVPGQVDATTGTCHQAPNLGWTDVDVRGALSGLVAGNVDVLNDAQAALVGEAREGAARGLDDVVLLYAGTGISAAVLIGGQPYTGASGAVGEIGHCRVTGACERCMCGRIGCLETVASGRAVVRRYLGGRRSRTVSLQHVVRAAEAGDEAARGALSDAGRALGRACGLLVNILNPRAVVVAGGLSDAGEVFLGPLHEEISAESLSSSFDVVSVRIAALGTHAELRGSVLHGLERLASQALEL